LKVINIVREEMNKAGAQEILMPAVQPIELWQQTGRDVDYGPTMAHFEDRHGRQNVLAPTAEEVVTSVAAGEIKSYKQLPMNLYQISFKFRDEFRPRFGVLRSREFIMKDAYSFHANAECLDKEYWNMYETYKRIFKRCGLDYVIVEAESGEMGGTGSHQFTIPCPSGEDIIVYTEDGSYAANIEKAAVDAPTYHRLGARENTAKMAVPPELVHTPSIGSIEAVCGFLKTKPEHMIKTLIYWEHNSALQETIAGYVERAQQLCNKLDEEKKEFIRAATEVAMEDSFRDKAEGEAKQTETIMESNKEDLGNFESLLKSEYRKVRFTVAVVRGDHEVNAEKLRVNAGKSLELATEDMIEWLTGAKVGFAGPMGLAEKVDKMIIDYAVAAMAVGVTGANKTDYHIKHIVPGRDFPLEGDKIIVADIRNAVEGDTHNGKKLLFKHGIEVGQVFKLGTKYSVKLGCNFLDETGKENPCLMGCYGIGINRIVASAIEAGNDDNGIIFPISIAPFEVIIVSVNQDDADDVKAAEDIYKKLLDNGIEVLLDDRDERAGVKFKDADLIGIPVRINVGKKALVNGNVEIKLRSEPKAEPVPVAETIQKVIEMVRELEAKVRA
jgi:prolyl-tRNA synthetase